MKFLMSQEEFEAIIFHPEPRFTAIYFGATWCGPCRRIEVDALNDMPGIDWLKCDVDQDPNTPRFCSIRSIPAFMVIANGKATGPMQSTDTNEIMDWVNTQKEAWIKNSSKE